MLEPAFLPFPFRYALLAALAILVSVLSGRLEAETLAQPDDRRWVVVASRMDLAEAISIANRYQRGRVVESENGWYAIVLGPYPVRRMAELQGVYEGPDLPADAMLARGSNYRRTLWSGGEKWVVIASRSEIAEAIATAEQYAPHGSRVVRSENGWYAIVLGPHAVKDIGDFRASFDGPSLPPDAILAAGANFMQTVWQRGSQADEGMDPASGMQGEPRSIFRSAFASYRRGDDDEAAALFRTGLARDDNPQSAGPAHYFYGRILLRRDQVEAAEIEFRQAYSLAPDSAQGQAARYFVEGLAAWKSMTPN